MTVEANTSSYTYTGDGVTKTFPFPSRFLAANDLQITINGLPQTSGVGISGVGSTNGGSVTFTTAPASGARILINRVPPLSQLVSFQGNSVTLGETLEKAVDRQTMNLQVIERRQARSFRLADADLPATLPPLPLRAARAGRLLAFDANGTPYATTPAEFMSGVGSGAYPYGPSAPYLPLPDTGGGGGGGGGGTPIAAGATFIVANDYSDGSGSVENDTAALQAAVAASGISGLPVLLTRFFKLNETLEASRLGFKMVGIGVESSGITGYGTPGILIRSTGAEQRFEGFRIEQTGTGAECLRFDYTSLAVNCTDMKFRGDINGALVYSRGNIICMSLCTWDCNSASTIATVWNAFNQNCTIFGGRVGGIGVGHRIIHTNLSEPRVEGFKMIGHCTINTGDYNVHIGDSLETLIDGCVLDQGSGTVLKIGEGATDTRVMNSWFGCRTPTGACVNIFPDAGPSHSFIGCKFNSGLNQLVIDANSSQRVTDVTVMGCGFYDTQSSAMVLNSVADFRALSNYNGYAPSGSWNTSGSHPAGGTYRFGFNSWYGPQAFRAPAPSIHSIFLDTNIG